MIHDFRITVGDVCGDVTGLRVKVEDVDMYDYVHFSVIENGDAEQEPEIGEMSHIAFVRRFTRVGQYIC